MSRSGGVAIIDDERPIRRALLRLFRLSDFEAEAFESATAFLDAYPAYRPDCIVLDLRMPGMDGIGLLRRLAAMGAAPPVVIVSAIDDAGARGACEAFGVSSYLTKPVDQRMLIQCVRRLIDAPALAQRPMGSPPPDH